MSAPSDLQASLAATLCLALGGCTTVTVVDRGGGVTVSRHLLTVGVQLDTSRHSQTLRSRGVGVFASPMQVAVGLHSAEVAVLGPDCRAVIWPASAEQAQALTRLVDLNRICIAPNLLQSEVR